MRTNANGTINNTNTTKEETTMNKIKINTKQELVNKAQQYRIATENKSIEQIAKDIIDKLMRGYDEYTSYIENYRQQLEVKQNNDKIIEEVTSIKQLVLQVNNMQYCVYVGDPTYFYQEDIDYAGTKEECQAYIKEHENDTPYDDTTTCSYRMEKTPLMPIDQIIKLKEESIMLKPTNTATINYNENKKEESAMKTTKKDYTLNGIFKVTKWQDFKMVMKSIGIKCGTKTFEQLKEEALEIINAYDNKWYVLISEHGVYCKVNSRDEAFDIKERIRDARITIWTPIEFGVKNEHLAFIEHLTLITKDEMFNKFNYKKEEVTMNINTTAVTVPVGDMSEDKLYPELQEEKKTTEIIIDRKHGDYLVKNIMKASFVATKGDSKDKRIVTMHKLFGIVKAAYTVDNKLVDEAFIKNIINQLVTLKYITFKKYESGAMIFYPTVKAADYIKNHK